MTLNMGLIAGQFDCAHAGRDLNSENLIQNVARGRSNWTGKGQMGGQNLWQSENSAGKRC